MKVLPHYSAIEIVFIRSLNHFISFYLAMIKMFLLPLLTFVIIEKYIQKDIFEIVKSKENLKQRTFTNHEAMNAKDA